jgi:hypothetical protein
MKSNPAKKLSLVALLFAGAFLSASAQTLYVPGGTVGNSGTARVERLELENAALRADHIAASSTP